MLSDTWCQKQFSTISKIFENILRKIESFVGQHSLLPSTSYVVQHVFCVENIACQYAYKYVNKGASALNATPGRASPPAGLEIQHYCAGRRCCCRFLTF